MTPGTSMWSTKVWDPSAPRAPARSPRFPPLPRESIQGAPTANSHPRAHRTDPRRPPRSTGQAPATPSRRPPSEISRQAVRRQPAEDRLYGAKVRRRPPLNPRFPSNGTRDSRCSHPSLTRRSSPRSPLSTPRFTSIRPTLALEGVPYVDRVKYAEAQPEKPKRGWHQRLLQAGRVQHGLSLRSSTRRRSRAGEAPGDRVGEGEGGDGEAELAASGRGPGRRG